MPLKNCDDPREFLVDEGMKVSPWARPDDADDCCPTSLGTGNRPQCRQLLRFRRAPVAYADNGLMLLILILISDTLLIGGVFYPIRVVSPSMMPTFNGPRFRIPCARCGFPQTWCAATQSLPECLGRAVCPNCGSRLAEQGREFATIVPKPAYFVGDRVLLLKGIWRGWRRWDVVAFYNTGEKGGLTLKRIVGLPGERIEVRAGLLWVNGQPQPRPWQVQRAVCVPVWRPQMSDSFAIRLEATSPPAHSGAFSIGHPVTTYCHFHPVLDQQEGPTRNLILRFRLAEFSPGTRLQIRSDFGTGHIDLVLELPSRYSIRYFEHNDSEQDSEGEYLSGKLPHRVIKGDLAISLVDQRFLFVVNDGVVAERDYATKPLTRPISRPFQITVEQGSATILELGLWKVSSYLDAQHVNNFLPGYYLLGDDPHISIDSRHFGNVPKGRVIGRVVNWPFARPTSHMNGG